MFVMKWTVCALLSRYCVGTLVRDITEIIYVLFADGFRSYLATDVVEKKGSVERSLPPRAFQPIDQNTDDALWVRRVGTSSLVRYFDF